LLNSCNNPEPVAGHQLFLEYRQGFNSQKYESIGAVTDEDGIFEFVYEEKFTTNDLEIRGHKPTNAGSMSFVIGIPLGRDIHVGNTYLNTNCYSIVKINPKRPTTSNDTIYYRITSVAGRPVFSKYVAGPFAAGQIIDTITYRIPQFYDLQNYKRYTNQSPSGAYYPYRLSNSIKDNYAQLIGKPFDEICFKYNEYEIMIE
jgi:hypothetical protein